MSDHRLPSPRILDCRWGRVHIDGFGTVKDAKLYPGGARAWDWRETGTRHDPGIQPADVAELLDHGATTIVLSRGVLRMLQVCPETLRELEQGGVTVEILPTPEAVERYNRLADSEAAVGALIHSTCWIDLCGERLRPGASASTWWARKSPAIVALAEIVGEHDRYAVEAQWLRRLWTQVAINDAAVAFGDDRDAKAELADRLRHPIDDSIVRGLRA